MFLGQLGYNAGMLYRWDKTHENLKTYMFIKFPDSVSRALQDWYTRWIIFLAGGKGQ